MSLCKEESFLVADTSGLFPQIVCVIREFSAFLDVSRSVRESLLEGDKLGSFSGAATSVIVAGDFSALCEVSFSFEESLYGGHISESF